MPPLRTADSVKSLRTERTHEENQERAYIAASRRNDRSIEARVESARRASDIHKRRTGRALRITEKDVINEEMYEEEDDDLPSQYRRLATHLQTGNFDLNRRLQAYLTSHLAMRAALGGAFSGGWQNPHQGSSNHQFGNANLMQTQQPAFATPTLPQQIPSSNYRQSPYQRSRSFMHQGVRPDHHGRSASIATPEERSIYHQQQLQSDEMSPAQATMDGRRMSSPAHILPPTPQPQQGSQPSPALSCASSRSNATTLHAPVSNAHSAQPGPRPTSPPQQHPVDATFNPQTEYNDYWPLSMSLPLESQQMLADDPALDLNDPMWHTMMPYQPLGTIYPQELSDPSCNKYMHATASSQGFQANFGGIHQTLTPSSLDKATRDAGVDPPLHQSPESATPRVLMSPFATSAGFGMSLDASDPDAVSGDGFQSAYTGHNTSGQNTPQSQNDDFSSFLDMSSDIFSSEY